MISAMQAVIEGKRKAYFLSLCSVRLALRTRLVGRVFDSCCVSDFVRQKVNFARPAVSCLLVFILTFSTHAATSSYRGDSAGFWDSFAVVAAKVEYSGPDIDSGKGECIDLRLLATVTGPLDAAIDPRLKLQLNRYANSAITKRPEKGSLVFVLIGWRVEEDGGDREYILPNSYVEFLPSNCAIWEIPSLTHEDVLSVIDNLVELRRQADLSE